MRITARHRRTRKTPPAQLQCNYPSCGRWFAPSKSQKQGYVHGRPLSHFYCSPEHRNKANRSADTPASFTCARCQEDFWDPYTVTVWRARRPFQHYYCPPCRTRGATPVLPLDQGVRGPDGTPLPQRLSLVLRSTQMDALFWCCGHWRAYTPLVGHFRLSHAALTMAYCTADEGYAATLVMLNGETPAPVEREEAVVPVSVSLSVYQRYRALVWAGVEATP